MAEARMNNGKGHAFQAFATRVSCWAGSKWSFLGAMVIIFTLGRPSRLRKNGLCDLDPVPSSRFYDSGKSFGRLRWWPEDPFSGRWNFGFGLRRLNCQIPHAD